MFFRRTGYEIQTTIILETLEYRFQRIQPKNFRSVFPQFHEFSDGLLLLPRKTLGLLGVGEVIIPSAGGQILEVVQRGAANGGTLWKLHIKTVRDCFLILWKLWKLWELY